MQVLHVAGLPRCGSSWAARVFAAARASNYLDEPFNYETYPDRQAFYLRYVPRGCREPNVGRILKTEMRKQRPLWRPWKWPKRFVIKDVHAYPTIERIHELYRCPIVVLVRNPLDMAASWARLDYSGRPGIPLINQPAVLSEFAAPFEKHFWAQEEYYSWFGAYWGLGYYVLRRICERIPACQLVRFEDLCVDSHRSFSRVLAAAGLPFLPLGHEFLDKHNRPPDQGESAYSVNRVSTDEAGKWRNSLTSEQVRSVIRGAKPYGLLDDLYPELLEVDRT